MMIITHVVTFARFDDFVLNRRREVRASFEPSIESYNMCEYHHKSSIYQFPKLLFILFLTPVVCTCKSRYLARFDDFVLMRENIYFMIMNRLQAVRASIEPSSESYKMSEYHHKSSDLSIPQTYFHFSSFTSCTSL